MATRQHSNEENVNQQQATNQKGQHRGVQTVPPDSEVNRDQQIKNEPGTERLRSEGQSVHDKDRNRTTK